MRVGLDVDDVLLNLVDHWLGLYNKKYHDALIREDITSWKFSQHTVPACGEKIYDFLTPDIYKEVRPFWFASHFVTALRNMGHTPVFVSSCGPTGGPDEAIIAEAKIDCLRRHYIARNGDEFIPGREKDDAPVDILLDDGLHNVKAFKGAAIVYDQPWNRDDPDNHPRAHNYVEALRLILRHAETLSLYEAGV